MRGVGEADGANGRQGEAGCPIFGHQSLDIPKVPDGAQPLGQTIGYGLGAGSAVPCRDLGPEAALLEHGAVEGQRQIARQLRLEGRHARGPIPRERGRHRGDNLEALHPLAGALAPAARWAPGGGGACRSWAACATWPKIPYSGRSTDQYVKPLNLKLSANY